MGFAIGVEFENVMLEKNNFTVFEIDDINQRVFLKREKLADDNNKWYEHNEELEVKHYSSFKILALSKGKNVLDSFAFSINYKREIYLERSILVGMAHFYFEDEKNQKEWDAPYHLYSCRIIPKLLPPQ